MKKPIKPLVSVDEIRRRFNYFPESGEITHRIKPRRGIKLGSPAGHYDKKGYRKVYIGRRQYLVHRIAWAISYGEWPSGEIDHINGDPSDNRISNLRVVTRSENQQNIRQAKITNKSGLLGSFAASKGRSWISRIRANGKIIYLGSFPSPEAAHFAYLEAKAKFHIGGALK